MITVTLTFANLGAAIRALRDIPEDALLESTSPKSEAPTEAPVRKARKSTTLTVVEPADAPAPTTASPEEAPAPVAAAEPAAPEPIAEAPATEPAVSTISYADLQKAVLKLYGKDRALATSVAVGLGFDTFKVMPADVWPLALAAVNEKLAEMED